MQKCAIFGMDPIHSGEQDEEVKLLKKDMHHLPQPEEVVAE